MKNLFIVLGLMLFGGACNDAAQSDLPLASHHTEDMSLYGQGKQTYSIVCYWYDYVSDYEKDSYGTYTNGWEWAVDTDGYDLYIDGEFNDGFLISQEIYGYSYWTGKHPPKVAIDSIDSREKLNKLCQATIDKNNNKNSKKLYYVAATKYQEYGYAYPIVFTGDEKASEATRMVVFGDSLSDTGNLKNWLQIFPGSPYFLGRFSNGFVWVDYLKQASNVTVQNWAYGGATSYDLTADLPYKVTVNGIIDHVTAGGRNFVTGNTASYINQYINNYLFNGVIQNQKKTVFVIWTGANDYGSKFDSQPDLEKFINEPNFAVNQIDKTTSAIIAQMDTLYQAGARNIIIANLPNLGITPLVATNTLYEKPTSEEDLYHLSVESTLLIGLHNTSLAAKLDKYRIEHQDVNLILFDVFDALEKMMQKQSFSGGTHDYNFDFENLTVNIVTDGHPTIIGNTNCYAGGYLGTSSPKDATCPEVSRAMFYDKVHPTTYMHCWLSYFMQHTMFEAGLISQSPDIDAYQALCEAGM